MRRGPSESCIVADVIAGIGSLPGVLAWRNNTGCLRDDRGRLVRYGATGSADILACVRGRFVALEAKSETGRQSREQAAWQRAVEAAGGIYAVVRSADEARRVVEGAG